jgi:hypothetical protein
MVTRTMSVALQLLPGNPDAASQERFSEPGWETCVQRGEPLEFQHQNDGTQPSLFTFWSGEPVTCSKKRVEIGMTIVKSEE